MKEILRKTIGLYSLLKSADKKISIIFLSLSILQTISYYYFSRKYFVENLIGMDSYEAISPVYAYIYWFCGDFILLFIIPVLLIRLVFKENIMDYGFKLRYIKSGIYFISVCLLFTAITVWFLTSDNSYSARYSQYFFIREDWGIFVLFETIVFLYMFAWEFVWRGYMLFGLKEKLGVTAVFVQILPFVILHNGKPALETFSSVFGALILGILAYRTGTFLYGVLIHFGLFFFFDLLSVLRFRTGVYGIGVEACFNLIKKIF